MDIVHYDGFPLKVGRVGGIRLDMEGLLMSNARVGSATGHLSNWLCEILVLTVHLTHDWLP